MAPLQALPLLCLVRFICPEHQGSAAAPAEGRVTQKLAGSQVPRDVPSPGAQVQQVWHAHSTPLAAGETHPRALSSAPNTAKSRLEQTQTRDPKRPPHGSSVTLALGRTRARGRGHVWPRGRVYLHRPPATPAILQSHLYHQVMPSSAQGAPGSGAAAWNCSS